MMHKLPYRKDIDGLRAIAVIAVVLYHAFPELIHGGFIGVDIFFVISGFLISRIILQELGESCFSFFDFYRRRIVRIFPALLITLILCVLFGWLVLSPEEFRQLSKHTLGGATFTSNFMYLSESGYFDNASITKPLLHLWSLSIEEQFYIIWPLLIVFAFKRKLLLLVIFLVSLSSFAFNIYLSSHNLAIDFYSPATRFWELACGSVLAWLAQKRSLSPHRMPWIGNAFSFLGLLIIAGGFYLISTEARFPGWWAILPVLGTSLVIISGPESLPNKKILSNAGLVWVGLISYPLYLVHWPIFSFTYILLNGTPSILLRCICIISSFILAFLIFRFIEAPTRKINKIFISLIALMVLVGIFGWIGACNGGFKDRFEFQLPQITSGESDCYSQSVTEPCVLGNLQSNQIILVYGDSHAGHLINALNKTFGAQYKLIFFGNNCFVGSIGSEKPKIWGMSEKQCELKQNQMKELVDKNVYAVIRSQRWTIYNPSSPERIQDLMSEAINAGGLKSIKLVIVGAVPNIGTFKCEVASVYSSLRSRLCSHKQDNMDLDLFFISEVNKLDKPKNISFIHPYNYLCDGGECQVIGKEGAYFYDDDHLTTAGALKLMPSIQRALKQ